jgi:ribosome-associated protein
MNIQTLQKIVVDALEDVKGQDIKVFDTTDMTELFDRVIITSGTSNRQTRALADRVRQKVKAAGAPVLSVEGEDTGEWVLVDLADAVVHIMQPAIRAYYNLEELWGGKPVSSKPAPRARRTASNDTGTARKSTSGTAAPRKRKTDGVARSPAKSGSSAKSGSTAKAATSKAGSAKAGSAKAGGTNRRAPRKVRSS